MAPNSDDFRSRLSELLGDAEKAKLSSIDISSSNLHQSVGGYPPAGDENHAMPACCEVMRRMMRSYTAPPAAIARRW